MLDYIRDFFIASPYIAWSILSVLIILIFIAYAWEQVKWWWLNTWMSFPLIGRISRLSRDLDRTHDGVWFKSEKALSSAYMPYVRVMSERDYLEKVDYLVNAGDNGRTFMPGLLWPVIVAMVFLEAMGFSYVLAGYTIPGASENLQEIGAYGIAFLVSSLLLFITHFAGHELYVNTKINSARLKWIEDNKSYNLGTEIVPLAKPQSTDADQPDYTRNINRIGSKVASYKMTLFATIFILVVAIGATYVRGQVLEKSQAQEIAGTSQQVNSPADPLNMGADTKLPGVDSASDKNADNRVANDAISIDKHGAWGTFIVLAFIFLGLQLLSIFFGFRWGFAGQNSKDAFKAIGSGRYSSYTEVRDQYNFVCDTAQDKLEDLQQKMLDRNSQIGSQNVTVSKNTFYQFLAERRKELEDDRSVVDEYDQRNQTRKDSSVTKKVSAQTGRTKESAQEFDIKVTMEKINSLSDKEDKKSFIASLTEDQQSQVTKALKVAKTTKLNQELDDLL